MMPLEGERALTRTSAIEALKRLKRLSPPKAETPMEEGTVQLQRGTTPMLSEMIAGGHFVTLRIDPILMGPLLSN